MEFHTVLSIVNTDGLARKTWRITPLMEATAEVYFDCLPKKKGGLGKGLFSAVFPGVVYKGNVIECGRSCAVVCMRDTQHRIGLSTLIMTGTSARCTPISVTAVEQKYCLRFMKRHATKQWHLPMPPLEIEPRPLSYNVLFRLKATATEWDDTVKKMVDHMNGLTLAVLRCLGVKHKEPSTGET